MTENASTQDGRLEFTDRDLHGARFVRCDLSEVTVRGGSLAGADLDDPWLGEGGEPLLVNGVDVAPLVEAELNRSFPGREQRAARTPEGLRAAWEAVQRAWDAAVDRASALPVGAVDQSVDGEWSFAQTLRHLVMATDVWLRGAILGVERPYHPIGQPHAEYETDGYDLSVFSQRRPSFEEVLRVRAGRVAMVRDFLAGISAADLDMPRRHPWAPQHEVDTLHCLHTILGEEWEHLRYALRDLDVVAADTPS